jgi:ABC-type multidrug transport system ATPase subunit
MGPSGSGKTSLISVAGGLVDPADLDAVAAENHSTNTNTNTNTNTTTNNNNNNSSSLVIHHHPDDYDGSNARTTTAPRPQQTIQAIPRQLVGVVWQDDLLLSNLTVEETIYFAARLKTPSTVSDKDVETLVEETMLELGLLHVRHNLIGRAAGGTGFGISGGERKRVAVAVELVVRPSLLLCDEPTSGLDATTAVALVGTLKNLAAMGHSVVVVVHQPRTELFRLLDRLLLMSKGRAVYDGPPNDVRDYLEKLPYVQPLPPETGIADWIMDTIIADEKEHHQHHRYRQYEASSKAVDAEQPERATRRLSLADHWANHRRGLQTSKKAVGGNHVSGKASDTSATTTTTVKYEASFAKELSMLTRRISKQQRGDRLTLASVLVTVIYLVFTNFLYWRLPDDTSNVYERNSLLFFLLIAQGMGVVTNSIAVFHRERALLRRERAKKLYRVLPFFLAKAASDMTNNIFLPMLYGIIMYWTAGLRPSVGSFLRFALGFYLSLSCAQSMGFFLSILYPDPRLAIVMANPITLFMFIAAGFYIPIQNLNPVMKVLSYVSFARYGYSALLVNEYDNREIPCPPENSGELAISIGGGNCPLAGLEVVESIGLEGFWVSYWSNIGILALFQLSFLVGAYVLLRKTK